MVDRGTIDGAARILCSAAPGAVVILFGSYARGDARDDSDVDLAVLEVGLTSRHDEMIRLRDLLRPLRIPVDLVVTDRRQYQKWSKVPGTVWYEVAQEGEVLAGVS